VTWQIEQEMKRRRIPRVQLASRMKTIRTALLKDGKAYLQAGGGWVNDSEPEAEFQETVNKSKAMFKAVALAETFTTNP
jgi:hypothetical protein